MALSIKTEEADRLARRLAKLTGETMTEAVTVALRERLTREQASRKPDKSLPARLAALSEAFRAAYGDRPVTQEELEMAGSDEWDLALRDKQK